MHNPYQSTATSATEVIQPPIKRPLSVWLLLLVLGVMTIALAIGTARSIWLMAAYPSVMLSRFGANTALFLALVLFGAGALVGIARRRQWGRWLGLLVMVALTAAMFLMPDTTHYANAAQQSGGFFGRTILMPSLMLLWAYRFGFSRKAKRYFAD
ncbi:hypothetical protein F2P44_11365 [Massilia sp. CCM 8695]|uniref:DUF2569 domain-containing protein n=1 Tax=Massilia frigida TaxID=2609281 RepID=A0ABX0NGQ4_9BURK|nr:hypothetical protein [Massilia frigida]NHZ79870.1 hypothetical protein [Massilia frigida]